MDISGTLAPDSTQINAEDFLAGPRTVTVTGVSKGTSEQPVNIDLAEFPGRSFRPCKSMRRVLVAAWGPDASVYIGRRMLLYREASVKFGGQEVGGIRIGALSHIDHKLTLALTMARGRRVPFTIEPLAETETSAPPTPISDDTAADFARDITEATTLPELEQIAADLKNANLGTHRKQLLDTWTARKAELSNVDAEFDAEGCDE